MSLFPRIVNVPIIKEGESLPIEKLFNVDELTLFDESEVQPYLKEVFEITKDLTSVNSAYLHNLAFSYAFGRVGGSSESSKDTLATFSYLFWYTDTFNTGFIISTIFKAISLHKLFEVYERENLPVNEALFSFLEKELNYDRELIDILMDIHQLPIEDTDEFMIDFKYCHGQSNFKLTILNSFYPSGLEDVLNNLNIKLN